jgi:nucleoside-diphosphate-sugar epimerase
MKVIVTGGAGFIGSHLCEKLLEKGYQVLCIDNLITGSDKNIEHLKGNSNFEFLNYDVIKKLPDNLNGDQIYHMASPASPHLKSPISYHALPFETMAVNTLATWNLCQWAIDSNAKLLFASTSEIYGDPKESPQKEEYRGNVSPTGPRSVYDESKRFGETIVSSFVRSKGMDGRIIRIFNTYGPRLSKDGRVVTEFITSALANEVMPIFGDGSQTRSFCYISDLVEGIILAMEKDGTKGEVFNLGNPEEYKISELAAKVKYLTASSSEIRSVEALPEDDPHQRCPDITKAREKLGWEPKVKLDEGLGKFIVYVKANLLPSA